MVHDVSYLQYVLLVYCSELHRQSMQLTKFSVSCDGTELTVAVLIIVILLISVIFINMWPFGDVTILLLIVSARAKFITLHLILNPYS